MNLKFWESKPPEPPKPLTISEVAQINRDEYKKMLSGLDWQAFGTEPELLWVYTDRLGYNYYVAKNIWQGCSRDRLAALESAGIDVECRMGRGELLTQLRKIMADCQRTQSGDVQGVYDAYKTAWEMHEIMSGTASEVALLEYAVNLIFTDGEDPRKMSPHIYQEKRNRAANDLELRAFFLDMAHSITQTSLPSSAQDLHVFSAPQKPITAEEAKEKKKEATRNRVSDFIAKSKARGK